MALAAFAGRYLDVYDEWNVCLSFFKVICGAVFEPRRWILVKEVRRIDGDRSL